MNYAYTISAGCKDPCFAPLRSAFWQVPSNTTLTIKTDKIRY